MGQLFKIFTLFLALLTFGCSESDQSQQEQLTPVQPAPEFATHDDPKEFFAAYLDDLGSERFLPERLVTELNGHTNLAKAAKLIKAHHTKAFIEWYFSKNYLNQVWDLVDKKVARMDYQLKVLDVPEEDAEDVLFVTDAGPLDQKTVLLNEELLQEWEKKEEGRYQLLLSTGEWWQPLYVVKEEGSWKLEVANF